MSLTEILPRAIAFAYIWMLIGAAVLFKPVERTMRGRLLILSFVAMFFGMAKVPFRAALAVPSAIGIAVAFALFNWAAYSIRGKFFSYIGSSDTPEFVFQGGPFAYIRHPFYTSYLLAHLATALVFPHWITAGALLIAAYSANGAAAFEEGKFEQSSLASEYRAYKDRTGRFLPGL